jgi:hypothetical protein
MAIRYVVRKRKTPLPPPIKLGLEDTKAFNWLFDDWVGEPLPAQVTVHDARTKSGKLIISSGHHKAYVPEPKGDPKTVTPLRPSTHQQSPASRQWDPDDLLTEDDDDSALDPR